MIPGLPFRHFHTIVNTDDTNARVSQCIYFLEMLVNRVPGTPISVHHQAVDAFQDVGILWPTITKYVDFVIRQTLAQRIRQDHAAGIVFMGTVAVTASAGHERYLFPGGLQTFQPDLAKLHFHRWASV